MYRDRIIYQIYPLSYKDSNNDGYGDINGIISKLDYLKDLGVGILWLSPIYASDFKDNGYDIIDYYQIHPKFGTMEEFENFTNCEHRICTDKCKQIQSKTRITSKREDKSGNPKCPLFFSCSIAAVISLCTFKD